MKTARLFAVLFVAIFLYSSGNAENWIRSGYITEKEWNENKPLVFGVLKSTPGYNGCDGDDRALEFKIMPFSVLAGNAFDVNYLYVDGIFGGEVALDVWLTDWQRRSGYGRELPPLDGMNWNERDLIQVCVGSLVSFLTSDSALQSIVLWYDGPIEQRVSVPISDGTDTGDVMTPIPGFVYGPGTPIPATDPIVPNKPDFIIDRSRLFKNGVEQYAFNKSDTMCMEGKLKNIGEGDIDNDDRVRTRFLLSKGYKEDPHGEWIGIGSFDTRGDHVEQGESHTETVCVSLVDKPYIVPGRVYNIVTCADRTEINNNDGGNYAEEHESNNCTDEMVFEVEGIYNFSLSTLTLAGNQLDAGTMLQATVNVVSTQDPPNEDVPVAIFLSPNQDWNNRWLADTFLIPWSELQGGFASWTRNIAVPAPGAYTLWTCVNPIGSIPETIGEDNCQSRWLEVLDVPPVPQTKAPRAIITIIQMML